MIVFKSIVIAGKVLFKEPQNKTKYKYMSNDKISHTHGKNKTYAKKNKFFILLVCITFR